MVKECFEHATFGRLHTVGLKYSFLKYPHPRSKSIARLDSLRLVWSSLPTLHKTLCNHTLCLRNWGLWEFQVWCKTSSDFNVSIMPDLLCLCLLFSLKRLIPHYPRNLAPRLLLASSTTTLSVRFLALFFERGCHLGSYWVRPWWQPYVTPLQRCFLPRCDIVHVDVTLSS